MELKFCLFVYQVNLLTRTLIRLYQILRYRKISNKHFSAFLFYEPEKVPAIFKDLNADHQRMFDAVKASGLKWIAVLPPHITGTCIQNLKPDLNLLHHD